MYRFKELKKTKASRGIHKRYTIYVQTLSHTHFRINSRVDRYGNAETSIKAKG